MIDDDTSYFFDLMNTVSESIRQGEHGTLQRGAEQVGEIKRRMLGDAQRLDDDLVNIMRGIITCNGSCGIY